ncbi:uridine diphosphate-N-acetylglucosamine-binding protein YvcK [Candidatus Woesearchaeota archaeon]|jgi:uncharacterized cofD-like protein|nr:uridine diphosphate-N-acetylglucosamine-binding protein YvcK [Candidatus Woesearchaeota archaeon]MBT6044639.1 uridine diphosphate-N-acetylglucosamine-binding protein YvcK [Candidatus Woesearchaeota archaeon]MBT6402066.1 uridine diphosphate-N-acetylglucosamine-binding protein YvcK [Candidatus Woesearchaeota archaeon]
MDKPYSLVVLGGGSGCFSILRGLKKFSSLATITSIFTIADDGGSSGVLRSEFGILPPGDLRRHIAALSESSKKMVELLNFRFKDSPSVKDHSLGNLIYTALAKITGSDEGAIREMNNIFQTNESLVLPASLDKVKLIAEYENGISLRGETNIDNLNSNKHGAITKVHLEPEATAYLPTVEVLKRATHIILSAGDLYTSIVPILLVNNIPEAIRDSNAKIIYVSNLMTKMGETDNFKTENFIEILNKYLKYKKVDCVIVNKKTPSEELIKEYKEEGSEIVTYSKDSLNNLGTKVIEENLILEKEILRHNPKNTALAIIKYVLDSSTS